MSADLDKRLETAVGERDRLAAEAQRIAGRKQAAEENLEGVRAEVRAKNLDPDTLDATIEQLETAYTAAVEKLEGEVATARSALAPYQEKTNP
jgi:chromosome segregation ATPase